MTIKKSLRTAQKVSRGIDKAQRAAKRTDEAFLRVDAQMRKKPISTLDLVYDRRTGISSKKLDIQTAGGILTYGPAQASPTNLSVDPASWEIVGIRIRPLDMFVNDWATIVPVEVANDRSDFRPNVNWVKKQDRSSSHIFLLDPENSEYYYPVETDFTGDVLEGHPRTGLFAFEPFRIPTNRVELHLSRVKLGPPRSPEADSSGRLVLTRPNLRSEIRDQLEGPTVADGLQETYSQHTGCALAVGLLCGPALLAGAVGGVARFVS